MEIWRDILGYEGLYQVSNLGNVKSLSRNKILKPSNNSGYLSVCLSKNCVCKRYRIHRLVASAFIPNPNNLPYINHKDEDKTNNTVDNLEYCDCKYNINYGTGNQRRMKTQGKKVLCVELNKIFASQKEAARWIGKNGAVDNIRKVCNNKRFTNSRGHVYVSQTAYGYHWQYIK